MRFQFKPLFDAERFTVAEVSRLKVEGGWVVIYNVKDLGQGTLREQRTAYVERGTYHIKWDMINR